ncbi:putative ATP-dependent RNA helicase [Zancudomyces culisetae]|uniref:Putative ATP-dependent RNA helicase n=1 Tax=Zancudomyces culisetae TaxID=1213189 RepID=A0A1R1PVQ5_ZANCU|nr:putative ATP-dependent RNA helicase [Zancudomyces culisetae]|eukprot:OMH85048.1 putative ATP-dependent RNA helicase [Zancudomyces culisetae]
MDLVEKLFQNKDIVDLVSTHNVSGETQDQIASQITQELHNSILEPTLHPSSNSDQLLKSLQRNIPVGITLNELYNTSQPRFNANFTRLDFARNVTTNKVVQVTGTRVKDRLGIEGEHEGIGGKKVEGGVQEMYSGQDVYARGKLLGKPFLPGSSDSRTGEAHTQTKLNIDWEALWEDISQESKYFSKIPGLVDSATDSENKFKSNSKSKSEELKEPANSGLKRIETKSKIQVDIEKYSEVNTRVETPSPTTQLQPVNSEKDATNQRLGTRQEDSVVDQIIETTKVDEKQVEQNGKDKNNKKWAVIVPPEESGKNYDDLLNPAIKYPFELDGFQKEAICRLEHSENVFVAAHTSAGKTVVAEYAIALSMAHMTKTIYTSPIKALSNQKFREFCDKFGADNVGIITGDVVVRPEASAVIMTTEILRMMLYRGADMLRDVEFVVLDEVHYVNDTDRGVVWEEVIIMLPKHVTLVLLSATVSNTLEFSEWVGRTRKSEVYVVSTPKRPVPLEHYLYIPTITTTTVTNGSRQRLAAEDSLEKHGIYKIVNEHGEFNTDTYKTAVRDQSLSAKQAESGQPKQKRPELKTKSKAGSNSSFGTNRMVQKASQAAFGMLSPSFYSSFTPLYSHSASHNVGSSYAELTQLVNTLKLKGLTPAVMFVFSRKRCQEYAEALTNTSFLTSKQSAYVHRFIATSLSSLNKSDRELPQVINMTSLLKRGIGTHHSGLLPILKEIVEILFSRNLIGILFATETFAMGVNMPAKAVIFSGLQKHDGTSFRDLLSSEYTQMSGRAGRRGLDRTGTVILAPVISRKNLAKPDSAFLYNLILGKAGKLISQFKLSYSMILNLFRANKIRVEDMIKKSFCEHDSASHHPQILELIKQHTAQLALLDSPENKLDCQYCSDSIESLYKLCLDLANSHFYLYSLQPRSLLAKDRFVVVYLHNYGNCLATVSHHPPSLFSPENHNSRIKLSLFLPAHYTIPTDLLNSELASDYSFEFPTSDVLPPIFNYNLDSLCLSFSNMRPQSAQIPLALITCICDQFYDGNDPSFLTQSDLSIKRSMNVTLEYALLLKSRNSTLDSLLSLTKSSPILSCPNFNSHFALVNHKSALLYQLTNLQFSISSLNLALVPEYNVRVRVLKHLNYLTPSNTLTTKGLSCCVISSTSDSLLLTEFMFGFDALSSFSPQEIVAILSGFALQQSSSSTSLPSSPYECSFDSNLVSVGSSSVSNINSALSCIFDLAVKIQHAQSLYTLSSSTSSTSSVSSDPNSNTNQQSLPVCSYNPLLIPATYLWADALPFKDICHYYSSMTSSPSSTIVDEGLIIRTVLRINDLLENLNNFILITGMSQYAPILAQCKQLITRDIAFASSLYY